MSQGGRVRFGGGCNNPISGDGVKARATMEHELDYLFYGGPGRGAAELLGLAEDSM